MKLWIITAAAVFPVFAAVDGTVVNKTTGAPQPNAVVSLVQPGAGGMKNLGTVKTDASGKFHFDQEGAAGGPQLLQAVSSGVTYTKMLPPGTPASGVELDVYDTSSNPGTAPVAQDMILFQPTENQVAVNESVIFQNSSNATYNDPKNGTLHFYLPPEANGNVSVTVIPPGGMTIQQAAQKTPQANFYRVSYPVRPGETRFDLTYTMPAAKPMIVSGKVLHKEGPTRLVVPPGVTLQGSDITSLGQEPQTKASIYEVKGSSYKVEIQGSGSLQSGDNQSEDDSGAPTIQQIQPKVYDKLPWILGIALAVLGLGLVLLYRSDRPAPAAAEGGAAVKSERKPSRKGAVSR